MPIGFWMVVIGIIFVEFGVPALISAYKRKKEMEDNEASLEICERISADLQSTLPFRIGKYITPSTLSRSSVPGEEPIDWGTVEEKIIRRYREKNRGKGTAELALVAMVSSNYGIREYQVLKSYVRRGSEFQNLFIGKSRSKKTAINILEKAKKDYPGKIVWEEVEYNPRWDGDQNYRIKDFDVESYQVYHTWNWDYHPRLLGTYDNIGSAKYEMYRVPPEFRGTREASDRDYIARDCFITALCGDGKERII